MRVVAVSYALQPPSNLPPETTDLTPVKSHEFPVSVKNPSDYRAYYEGLRASVMQAKSILGDELTAWRDAVGTAEALKEPKATKEEGGEDEDENADEE
ncbi:hypothetical protein K474DRAFT_1658900 [Panus rudis PR-1116 ss-1]|nr:hypothetical protein K474DRAFT_1658900 [Panus rudis PR-1116 ss-1]